MMEALYRASVAGVRVELIIRGISCIRAGVPGLSDNIRVRSVLGRYLEHSRIYRFGHGGVDNEPHYLIGSADVMPRNLDRRVEVLVPIEHPKHTEWLDAVLEFLLADDIVRWELQPDDTWTRVRSEQARSSPTRSPASTSGSSSASRVTSASGLVGGLRLIGRSGRPKWRFPSRTPPE